MRIGKTSCFIMNWWFVNGVWRVRLVTHYLMCRQSGITFVSFNSVEVFLPVVSAEGAGGESFSIVEVRP